MRAAFSFLIVLSLVADAAQLSITPKTPPVVEQAGTVQFTANRPVEWSMQPGSKGSIDANGLYHAPASVKAKQTMAGCQVLPNNHIFNTRIDGLPLSPKSAQWMRYVDKGGTPLTSGHIGYFPGFPINTVTSNAPVEKMSFAYSPEANGLFHVLPPAEFKMESGYYSQTFGGPDRHTLVVENDTCMFQEMYNLYPAGANKVNNCPSCTSQSGVRYSAYSYKLPQVATDAASLYLAPLSFHRDEIMSGSIEHALRFTLLGDFAQAAHVWPAIGEAGYNHNDVPPFGTRFRLRSDFSYQSKNPIVQTLITQLKRYGIILADIGGQWDITGADVDMYYDPAIKAAFKEVSNAVSPSALEVVDESSLMENPESGETPSDAEVVVATDKSSGKKVSMPVVLTGVTIGAEAQYLVIQSGAPAHRVKTWINGSNDKAVIWSMKPAIGSLTPDGMYKAPDHLTSRQELFLIAQAHADPRVLTTMRVILLPSGPIRIDNGYFSNYKDSQGNIWGPECCTPYAVTWDYSSFPWPETKDIKLYKDDTVTWGDIGYDFLVPPGKYRITAKMAEPTFTSPNVRKMHLEAQGRLIYRDIDLFAQAGVRKPVDFDLPAEVGPDGRLSFVVRHVVGEQALLSAFQIVSDPGVPRLEVSPGEGGKLTISQSKQFYPVAWYLANSAVKWSISPSVGTIDSNGLYKAPSAPVSQDTAVTITATSEADPKLSAHATVTIAQGIPAIRVNCGGSEFTDAQGHVWSGDYGYDGGVTYDGGNPIEGAPPDMQKLYKTSRYAYGTQSFSYTFPAPNGSYIVKLKWAEYRPASEVAAAKIAYKMSVAINGHRVLNNFDPIAAAGGVLKAYDQSFATTVNKGEIHLTFEGLPGAGYVGSEINGIEIVPEPASH